MADGPLKYESLIYWSSDDAAFVAEIPELTGCMANGAIPGEALANAQLVAREWLEAAVELQRPIPQPKGRLPYA